MTFSNRKQRGCLIAVKVANALTEVGVFGDGELLGSWEITTRASQTADEVECSVRGYLDLRDLPEPGHAVLCSVVPMLTPAWMTTLERIAGERPLVVGPGCKSGIAIRYKDPGQVGADRIALAVAAKALYGAPVVAVDFDVATSLSVVGPDGSFAGGAIMPGLGISLAALSDAAALLPQVGVSAPAHVIGRSTDEALRAGIVYGEAMRIDGMIEASWDELGCDTQLVATGAHANVVCPLSRHAFEVRPDLALQGLLRIWSANCAG